MSDINAYSGETLTGFAEIEQSLEKILTTPQGVRLRREWFGNPGLRLLGQNMTPDTIVLWYTILWTLVELFEPRFKIRRFAVEDADRLGQLDATLIGEHKPFAHLNWEQAAFFISVDGDIVRVREAA